MTTERITAVCLQLYTLSWACLCVYRGSLSWLHELPFIQNKRHTPSLLRTNTSSLVSAPGSTVTSSQERLTLSLTCLHLCVLPALLSLTLLLSMTPFSQGDSDTDSELEDRVDGVKSWLSKSKGSAKNLSDDGSLKSSRSVWAEGFSVFGWSHFHDPEEIKKSQIFLFAPLNVFFWLLCLCCQLLCDEGTFSPQKQTTSLVDLSTCPMASWHRLPELRSEINECVCELTASIAPDLSPYQKI